MSIEAPNKYLTWLLIKDPPNRELHDALQDLDGYDKQALYSKVKLHPRVPVSLRVKNKRGYLRTPEPRKLFEDVAKGKDRGIRAFSLAPLRDLKELHGSIFFYGARYIKVTWDGASDNPNLLNNPYYRRFLTLYKLGSGPQDTLDNKENTEVGIGELEESDPPLLLSPERVLIDAFKFNLWCYNRGKVLSEVNGVFLPPVRTAVDSKSYFSETRRNIRKKLRPLIDIYSKALTPTALTAWKLLDDPLMCDLLLDGGYIDIFGDENAATKLQLNLFANEKHTSLDWLRKTIFLNPGSLPGPPWVAELGNVLRQDLLEEVGGHIQFRAAKLTMHWRAATRGQYHKGGRKDGTHQNLRKLKKYLRQTKSNKQEVENLDDFVIIPSWPIRQDNPDNSLAQELFISNVFRCPWSDADNKVWRLTMVDFVKAATEGVKWFRNFNIPGFHIEKMEDSLTLYHPPDIDDEDILNWRLLLPLGTVITSRSTIKLDTPSARLNEGFFLAEPKTDQESLAT